MIMNCDDRSTFTVDTLAATAASKTIELLRGQFKIEALWQNGKTWLGEFNSLWPDRIRIDGYPNRGVFVGDPRVRALFYQESCEAGILYGPTWFYNFQLMDKAGVTLAAAKDVLCKIKSGTAKLRA